MSTKYERGTDTAVNAIKAIAAAKGWEISQWCKRAKVSPRTVEYWLDPAESRMREPTVSILQKLADAAGIPIVTFFLPDLKPEDVKTKLQDTVIAIPSCPAGTQAHIRDTVKFVFNRGEEERA